MGCWVRADCEPCTWEQMGLGVPAAVDLLWLGGKGVALEEATQVPARHGVVFRPPLVRLSGPAGQRGVSGWEGGGLRLTSTWL